MRSLQLGWLGVAFATLGLRVGTAGAQTTVEYTPDFDPDRFMLTADPDSVGLTESARPLAKGDLAAGLALRLGGPPLSICVENAGTGECSVEGDLVTGRLAADLVAAYGLGRLAVHAQLPIILYQGTDFDPAMDASSLSAASIGDLRLGGKLGITRFGDAALGWDLTFSLPTGGGDNFVGDAGTVIENRALLDWKKGAVGAAAGLGYAWRSSAGQVGDLYVDDELLWSVAGEYEVTPDKLTVGAALFGRIGLINDPEPVMAIADVGWEERPAELLGSATYRLSPTMSLDGGAGIGLDSGYGAPPYRLLVGLRWVQRKDTSRPLVKDTDGDGITDDDDKCVTDPEDVDDYEDLDGCPELDNDGDGIVDKSDSCPVVAEDLDGFEDTEGCPDPDNDKDGVLDGSDTCPLEPEDADNLDDSDGCPDVDVDADGILDVDDQCPRDPEVVNGEADTDGCPDERPAVVVTTTAIEITDMIFFDVNRARIKSRSYAILDAVADVLKKYADLRVEIQGHTDTQGDDSFNLDLSQRRAEAVREYLIGKGVAADRLEAKGYGETDPLVQGDDEAAWSKNRRVEFVIINSATGATSGAGEPVPAP